MSGMTDGYGRVMCIIHSASGRIKCIPRGMRLLLMFGPIALDCCRIPIVMTGAAGCPGQQLAEDDRTHPKTHEIS